MKNSDAPSPYDVSVIPSAWTICSFAKPTFCRSMNAIRNMMTSSGISRRAIFAMTARSRIEVSSTSRLLAR
ncbi:hypothetical protein NW94_20745 [Burkholderia mallei]|nr:hypothetical protein NW94_20745 [Burkholderia mallei]CAJ3268559.1 Uncharacterised protein [Burkholderia pseudomallei]KOT12871.1 major facilitator family transporter domain protein [Burkholderia mallei]KOT16294.1 major facilitator family transporter domain protein [Burkholderia mallei]KOT23919.1 major facilitator family transporter domain protein [Burkholderia mallei]